MRVAIITANTEIYRETEADEAGAVIREMMTEAGWDIVFQKALPLDRKVLGTVMQRMADGHLTDLILTTGGAGCKPQDCTPEATKDIIDREVPGIPEALRAHTMNLTMRSMLNRGTAGIRGDVLIINLPGKAKAVKADLRYLLPELTHAVEVVKGEV